MTTSNSKTLPPYVSYRTFWNFLDGLQAAVPARIDRSFWGDKLSGSTGGQLIGALKYLKMIDGNGVPTLRLKQIILTKGVQRSNLLKQLTQEAYPFFLMELEPANATYAQMEEKLKEHFQIAADVGRKCIKFYIGLAQDGGISLSPFVTRKSKAFHTTTSSRKSRRNLPRGNDTVVEQNPDPPTPSNEQLAFPPSPPVQSLGQMLMSKFPDFDPTWTDEVKLRWFQAFDELIQKFPGIKR
ncbi:DUF5343 domain-containing protein [Dehalogenimonas etheniformans]|uniref:Uncharacterized protein n=1 Tax=Dehalogenimonas etheniformans TaxID=1536648 RepID=A0A2P5P606_9CHLR|nr:DUF5343 domain-containing protein [Dehalogenimonas etheniformans]PPD57736.1 hypothetical protein JP09_008345 [Dehalogenimonas etheniformans]QNT76077.1 DUF5343 domain-containing protein [Dehalogenimonas etheniformans]